MQFLGGSFGAAVLVAAILDRQVAAHAAAGGPSLSALAGAFGTTFWWCTGFTAVALIPALLLPSRATVGKHKTT
jgi:hypothetical protein